MSKQPSHHRWLFNILALLGFASPGLAYAWHVYDCPPGIGYCDERGFSQVYCDGEENYVTQMYQPGEYIWSPGPRSLSQRAYNYAMNVNFWNSVIKSDANKSPSGDYPGNTSGALCVAVDGDAGWFGRWLVSLHPDMTPKTITKVGSTTVVSAPGSYPSQFRGCHWSGCTREGAYIDENSFSNPVQVKEMLNYWKWLYLDWDVYTKLDRDASFDVAWDIWFNKDYESAGQQNDGLEIMVWVDHEGYNADWNIRSSRPDHPRINPVGEQRWHSDISIEGLPGSWDVWSGRLYGKDESGEKEWNVVSFVRKDKAENIEGEWINHQMYFDALQLIRWVADKMNITCPAHSVAKGGDQGGRPEQPCLSTDWYYTSAQAGMEVWNWGSSPNPDNPSSSQLGQLKFFTNRMDAIPGRRDEWACTDDLLVDTSHSPTYASSYTNCAESGLTCGWDVNHAWYGCIPQP